MGGMFGESKFEVLQKVPAAVVPSTGLLKFPATLDQVRDEMRRLGLTFPVLFKPDLGERGWRVTIIRNEATAKTYLDTMQSDSIIQELVTLPLEFGVYYRRYPNEADGVVTSVVIKEMLSVEGDGATRLEELILKNDRAKLQWETLQKKYSDRLKEVLSPGEKLELVSIGNHCLGTKFLNGNHLINETLSRAFDAISKQIDGFYFGRFDLRTASLEDLYAGRVKVVELNGCGAEPAHIYQPGYSLWRALCDMAAHWKSLYRVSMENHKKGVPFTKLKDGLHLYRKFKKSMQNP